MNSRILIVLTSRATAQVSNLPNCDLFSTCKIVLFAVYHDVFLIRTFGVENVLRSDGSWGWWWRTRNFVQWIRFVERLGCVPNYIGVVSLRDWHRCQSFDGYRLLFSEVSTLFGTSTRTCCERGRYQQTFYSVDANLLAPSELAVPGTEFDGMPGYSRTCTTNS